jgi:hypothetical protein
MATNVTRTMDLNVTQEQLAEYYTGNILLQNAFPQLSDSEREFIKTGITDQEWNDLFSGEEE